MLMEKKQAMKKVGMTYPHLITIQQLPESTDQYNTPMESEWQDVVTVWASIEPIQGREYVLLQNTQSELTTRIQIRYRPGIKPSMRALYGSRVFDIQSVIDYEERHIDLQLMCVEKAGD